MSQKNAGLMASKHAPQVSATHPSAPRNLSRPPTASNHPVSASRDVSPSSRHSSPSRSAAPAPVLPSQTGINPGKSVSGPGGKSIHVRMPPAPSMAPPGRRVSGPAGEVVVRLPQAPDVGGVLRGRSLERAGTFNQAGASGQTAAKVPSTASDKRSQAVFPQRGSSVAAKSPSRSPPPAARKSSPSPGPAGSRTASPAGPLSTEQGGKYLDQLPAQDYPVVGFRPNSSMLVSDGIITISVSGKRVALPYGAKDWSAFTNECQHRMTSPYIAFEKARGLRQSNDVPSLGLFLRKSLPRQAGATPYYAIGFEDPKPVASDPPSSVASWINNCLNTFPGKDPLQTLDALANAWRKAGAQKSWDFDLTWLVYPPSARTGFSHAADVGALVGFRYQQISFLGPIGYLPWVPYAGMTAKQAYVAANSYEQDKAQTGRTDVKSVREHLQIRIWRGYDGVVRVALKLKDDSPAKSKFSKSRRN